MIDNNYPLQNNPPPLYTKQSPPFTQQSPPPTTTTQIFGPVLSISTFKTEQEAVAIANDSAFGLGAAVISSCPKRCKRVVESMETGIVWVNCSQPCFTQAPWGGIKVGGCWCWGVLVLGGAGCF